MVPQSRTIGKAISLFLSDWVTICVAASLETLRKDPTIHALQKSMTTGCLELLSEISKTVPDVTPLLHECIYQAKRKAVRKIKHIRDDTDVKTLMKITIRKKLEIITLWTWKQAER